MSKLSQHLDELDYHGYRTLYATSELGYVMFTIYGVITWTLRDHADTITLTSARFTWTRGDELLGEFPIARLKPTIGFAETFDWVLDRDRTLRRYLTLITKTPTDRVYRLLEEDTS